MTPLASPPPSLALPRIEAREAPPAHREARERNARAPAGELRPKVLVAQLGARMHYAVPRILHEAGALDRLATDICAAKGWPRLLRLLPPALRSRGAARLAGRVPQGLPPERIATFTAFGLEFARRQALARSPSEVLAVHGRAGRAFAELVRDRCLGPGTTAVYCFNSAGLELMRAAAERGLPSAVEQTIAPRTLGARLLAEEHGAFPGWEAPLPDPALTAALAARERAEWTAADRILCGSAFVRDGIAAEGGPAERCHVVPYGVDGAFACPDRRFARRPLHVLTVGEVGLRKGAPYVAAAARRAGPDACFRMVGGTSLSPAARAAVGAHVELTGPIPRAAIHAHYRWADVFLLPSLYEGSATVVYEALAAGLPVICTPNTGSIVRDGVEGYIVPIRDSEAIVERLGRLADPAHRAVLAAAALQRAQEGQLDAYRDRLLGAMALASPP